MRWIREIAAAGFVALPFCALVACTSTTGSGRPGPAPVRQILTKTDAYLALADRLDTFRVTGAVKTSEGLLLPENIVIEIRSEVCVESRQPGTRFWSLDYDTCFVYVSIDTVSASGEYEVSVPCIDADQAYESSHDFGDLRLVPRGPVSFLADSDAGWNHRETFSSSRSQRRDLILTLEPEVFYVVDDEGVLLERPREGAGVIQTFRFGTGVEVVRFQKGWAQCVMGNRIGWMRMRMLGTEQEMKEMAPFKGKSSLDQLDRS